MKYLNLALSLLVFLSFTGPSLLHAQVQSYAPETKIPLRIPPAPKKTLTPKTASENAMPIQVQIEHSQGIDLGRLPVFLRAARRRGPFEPNPPKAKYEWTAITNTQGLAVFPNIPKTLNEEGLLLQAVVSYGGISFDSAPEIPSAGRSIPLKVHERTTKIDGVRFSNIRTMIEIWEGYLVFRQTYSIINRSDFAIDTSMLPGKRLEKGLPIDVPLKAQGIRAMGPGNNIVVNSTIFWSGLLLPGRSVELQIHYSIPVKEKTYVYSQPVNYPTENAEVIIPLQTQFKKIPRLSTLELRPPGFKETETGAGIFGLRSDVDFIGARGIELDAKNELVFQLSGLPFHKSKIPYFVFAFAFLTAIFVYLFAVRTTSLTPNKTEILEMLRREKDALLEELVLLDQERNDNVITQNEYQSETFETRERLALILKKLSNAETA